MKSCCIKIYSEFLPEFCILTHIFILHYLFPSGAPCNNFRGYCDVFQKCRDVDANGPLSRLKKLLFNEQTFNEIRDWIIVSTGIPPGQQPHAGTILH